VSLSQECWLIKISTNYVDAVVSVFGSWTLPVVALT
jgi:hypothetical protein